MSQPVPQPPRGYFQASNVSIPINQRPKGELANIAVTQLEAFQLRGRTWPLREVSREDDNNNYRHGMECSYCNQMIYFISDVTGILYEYTDDEKLALIVAHIRQAHERIVTRGTE